MNSSILTRVRALLAKAESTEFPDEADALNKKALELIARHGIDQAMLAADGQRSDNIKRIDMTVEPPYVMEKATLLNMVAQGVRCESVIRRKGRKIIGCAVVGYESDLERFALLYPSLLLQATAQLTRLPGPSRGETIIMYRKSWFLGFAGAIRERFRAAERQAADEARRTQGAGVSTELVLRDRTQLVNNKLAELFPDCRVRTARPRSGDGYTHGHAAGHRADLGHTRLGEHRRAMTR